LNSTRTAVPHLPAAERLGLTLYTPSGVLLKTAPLRLATKRLKACGFDVHVDEAALARHQRFGGDDETRLAAIHRVASQSPDIAMATRGGCSIGSIGRSWP
jgi:muramoyltetrapeptide carboxypeptidase